MDIEDNIETIIDNSSYVASVSSIDYSICLRTTIAYVLDDTPCVRDDKRKRSIEIFNVLPM